MKSFFEILTDQKKKMYFTLPEIRDAFNKYLDQQVSGNVLVENTSYKEYTVNCSSHKWNGLTVFSTLRKINDSPFVTIIRDRKKDHIHFKFLKPC